MATPKEGLPPCLVNAAEAPPNAKARINLCRKGNFIMRNSKTTNLIGSDRLLGIQAVADSFGVCPVTASRIIDDTGCAIILHRKKYILESSLYAYLREQEAM